MFREYIWEADGHRARQVERADDRDARDLDGLARLGVLAVPARLCREVDDHARAISAHRLARQQDGRRPPGMSAVVMTPSASAAAAATSSCSRRCWLRKCRRVPALGLLARDLELEERRAEALDLLAGGRADVECGDNGAEPARGGDSLEARDSALESEHPRRRDRARCRGQHRKNLPSDAATRSTAQPATVLWEDSASMDCERVILGTASSENPVTRSARARANSGSVNGCRRPTSTAPSERSATSSSRALGPCRRRRRRARPPRWRSRRPLRASSENVADPRARFDDDLDARLGQPADAVGHERRARSAGAAPRNA